MAEPRSKKLEQLSLRPKIDKSDTDSSKPVGDALVQKAHLLGNREFQEDGDTAFVCDHYRLMTPSMREKSTRNTSTRIDVEYKKIFEREQVEYNKIIERKQSESKEQKVEAYGACIGLVIIWRVGNTVHYCVANAGDVSIFAAKINAKKQVSVERLNSSLHAADEVKENTELKKKIKTVKSFRGDSYRIGEEFKNATGREPKQIESIPVYRSLGDYADKEKYGVTNEIDYVEFSREVKAHESDFALVCCDGVTECVSRLLDDKRLKQLAESNTHALMYGGMEIPVADIIELPDDVKAKGKQASDKYLMEHFVQLMLERSLLQRKENLAGKPRVRDPLDLFPTSDSRSANLAWLLTNWGLQFSGDNVSSMVIKPGSKAVCGMILDGHSRDQKSGKKIVDYARENFERINLEESYKVIKQDILEKKPAELKDKQEALQQVFKMVEQVLAISDPTVVLVLKSSKLFAQKDYVKELNNVKKEIAQLAVDSLLKNDPALCLEKIVKMLDGKWSALCLKEVKESKSLDANQILLGKLFKPESFDPLSSKKIPNHQLYLVIADIFQSFPEKLVTPAMSGILKDFPKPIASKKPLQQTRPRS